MWKEATSFFSEDLLSALLTCNNVCRFSFEEGISACLFQCTNQQKLSMILFSNSQTLPFKHCGGIGLTFMEKRKGKKIFSK